MSTPNETIAAVKLVVDAAQSLQKLVPLLEETAALVSRHDELAAGVTRLQGEYDAKQAEMASALRDAATIKQEAIDDIRAREAAHVKACEERTLQTQRDAEAVTGDLAAKVKAHDAGLLDRQSKVDALDAKITERQKTLDTLTQQLAAARDAAAKMLGTTSTQKGA